MQLQSKIYNNLMTNGNKQTAEKIFQETVKRCQKFTKKDHKKVFQKSLINLVPVVTICKVTQKNKKKSIDFPYIINKKLRMSLGIKLILRKKIEFIKRNLVTEIINSLKKNSNPIKSKETEQKNAIILKKASFFRWFY